jgi:hypothetical protein
MKITPILVSILLLGCSAPKTDNHNDILFEKVFSSVLKDIHLAEGVFELNKANNIENAKSTLESSYIAIYSKYKISAIDFKNTLNFYSQHPEKLEKIYSKVLEELNEERSTLDQQ